ncbi:MAG: CDP-alcohol phosphatidyltransferase family protein [Planctomycetes bacterium]|nr:CDP-alcohol phosphatidyltransferase family protein [Planctomycetota bacterium]
MGTSFAELRRVCQLPVAAGNDVAGLLFGDRASLPITKLFVDLGLSPSIATVGMLVTGLLGSACMFGGPPIAVIGAALLVLYYVLDCVDGEVARWRQIEHARWGYYEYVFHFIVKPTVFLSVGFAAWRDLGHMTLVVAGVAAAVATLWLKLFFAVPSLVFVGAVLKRSGSGDRPYRDYVEAAVEQARREAEAARARPAGKEVDEVFRLRFDLVTIRALGTNFDVGLLWLLLASAADLFVEPFQFMGLGHMTLRGMWLLYYGVVLPIDFFDYVQTYVRQGRFDRTMVQLIARAHGFCVAPGGAGPRTAHAEPQPDAAARAEDASAASEPAVRDEDRARRAASDEPPLSRS